MIPILVLLAAAAHGTISMPDIDGTRQTPFQPAERASVLFFITTDCPISNSYAPEIQRICAEYTPKGFFCSLIYVDPDLTAAAVRTHLREFRYSGIPAILDANHKVVRAAGATVTPETAVIDSSGKIVYRGRIDNVYASLGKRRPEPTERDLRKALERVLAGKPVSEASTKAIGCYIPPDRIKR